MSSETESESEAIFHSPKKSLKRTASPAVHSSKRVKCSIEDDVAFARSLQLQLEREDEEKRLADVEEDARIARELAEQEERAQKKGRAARMREKNTWQGVVFQVTMDRNGKTIQGDNDHDNARHLALVKQQFDTEMSKKSLRIKTVTYFCNHFLEVGFEEAKQALVKAGRDVTEINMFHGTAAPNVDSIIKTGFRIGGVDTKHVNGSCEGIGVYVAQEPTLSLGHSQGNKRMICCVVIPGKTTNEPMHEKPKKAGENEYDAYKSDTTGAISAGVGMFMVVRDAALVLPRYVVEFEETGVQDQYPFMPGAAPAFGGLAAPAIPYAVGSPGSDDDESNIPAFASLPSTSGFKAFSGVANRLC